ncbi:MAG: hypothetical protein DRN68_07350 [Thaumarchaeota archaeon]|nr:MAG: hypothetical protein DRN68_07350 [Nitrososphaerota archaeon]
MPFAQAASVGEEQRSRGNIFTVSIVGDNAEHKLMSISGLQRVINEIEHTESDRIDYIRLPGHMNVENVTFRDIPLAAFQDAAPNFLFELVVDGKTVGHVRRITGLGVRWDIITNNESNNINTQKLWGKRRYNTFTTEVVVEWSEKWQLWEFAKLLGIHEGPGNAFSTVGSFSGEFRKDVRIHLLDQQGNDLGAWFIHGGWARVWVPHSDLSADSTTVGTMSIEWAIANLPGQPGLEETLMQKLGKEHQVSQAWYEWVAKAYDVPERRHLIINIYQPGQVIGKDEPVGRLKLFNCWVAEINYQDFDATADDILTRDVVVACDGIVPL